MNGTHNFVTSGQAGGGDAAFATDRCYTQFLASPPGCTCWRHMVDRDPPGSSIAPVSVAFALAARGVSSLIAASIIGPLP